VAESLVDSGIARERIAIVNEGVEVPPLPTPETRQAARKRWGVKEDEFLFGCVGFLLPEKGQRYLIEALAGVRKEFPRARLLLAGDGPCRAELERLARELGQSEAVHFAGFVENVPKVYLALDTFLFPSLFEGMGTSLQAAMAWGLPTISTARGGLAEVVDDGRTALVVEPEGKQFAAAMLRLLREPAFREMLGRTAREEVENRFSANRMVNNTLGIYEEVSAEAKRASRGAAQR
jgi:glycosyltransferase involved in cell wall biosynthesis